MCDTVRVTSMEPMVEHVDRANVEVGAIIARLRRHAPRLRKHYGIRVLGVFGSYARGEQRPDSDLDVLVEPEGGATLLDLVGAQHELSDLLEVSVDIAIERTLKARIGRRIASETIRL